MISREPDAPSRARVIGSLTGDSIQVLLDAVDAGAAVLDLSGIDQIDHHAVGVLARLWPRRCTLLACPRWLELWLARVRHNGAGTTHPVARDELQVIAWPRRRVARVASLASPRTSLFVQTPAIDSGNHASRIE